MSDSRSIKKRQSKQDLSSDRKLLQGKAEGIRSEGTKMAADKAKLDELREMIEASDLPDDVKQQGLAKLQKQEAVLKTQWNEDVEKPEKELEKSMDDLAKENKEYADNATKNEEEISKAEAGLQSGMEASSLREAGRKQRENASFFGGESVETKRMKEEHRRELDEIRKMID